MKKIIGWFFKILIIFFLLLTFFFAYLSFFHKELVLEYLDKIKILVESLGYWNYVIILISGFVESFPLIGVSVPGQTILIVVAGFLGYDRMFISIGIAFIGAIFGNYIGYLIGIKYGEDFFKKYGNLIGIGMTDIKYIKKGIDKNGFLFVILGKFHNLFRAFVPFIAGSSLMHGKSFTLANVIGSFLRSVVMVLLGVFFVDNADIILKNIGKIMLFIIIIFALYVFFFKKEELKEYLELKSKEMDEIVGKTEVKVKD